MTTSPQLAVSVVVVNYNYGRFLRDAIDSALRQTYPHVEVVVVDDGSTDDSRAIIAGYGARIRPVLKANGGQASAFNAGLAASRGDLVIFLDADDLLFPQAVERVAAAWRPGVAKVQYRLQVLNRDGEPENVFAPGGGWAMPNGDVRGELVSRMAYLTPPSSGNAYARGVLAEFFPIPEQDWNVAADAYLHTAAPFYGEVVSISDPLGYRRLHGANTWATFKPSYEERLAMDVVRALKREALVTELAARQGLEVSPNLGLQAGYNAKHRLALKVSYPERYPRPEEGRFWLAVQAVYATWTSSRAGVRQRLYASAWYMLLPLLPRPLARRLARATLIRSRA